MPDVEFPANGSTATGYLAVPDDEDGQGHGVVVLHEWWGLDGITRSVCDRLAGDGFVALAPDLFHGETTERPDEAEQKALALDMARAGSEMRGAVEHLVAHEAVRGSAVGSLGFGLGGGLSLRVASASPKVAAAVAYYALLPHGSPDFAQIQGPVLGHFGTADGYVEVERAGALATELEDAGVPVNFEYYDGAGHAFFDATNRLGTYDPAAAERSWERTVAFLRESL
jgi:carboxymethylenebutenolidase